jgi:lipopolysaccharide transport system permease protein
LLVREEFVVKHKQTILGPLWYILQPLLTTVVFTVIFNRVARLPTDGLPPMLFYLGGLTIWSYFSQNLTHTSSIFARYASLFEKVYFPRLIMPIAAICSNVFALLVQIASFVGLIIFFRLQGADFNPKSAEALVLAPVLILQTAVLSLGVGLIFSALTAKYRDLTHLTGFILQIWMYASPVIYPASNLPDKFRWLILANPVAPIVENFRAVFLGVSAVNAFETNCSVLLTILILLVGLFLFKRTERTFIDSV